MIIVEVETTGIAGIGEELLRDARAVAKSALSKAATPLARRMRNKLSQRGGPSRPGDPPARVTGALRDTVGKDRPRVDRGDISVDVGIGVGKAKARRVAHWKTEGINVFEYALLHEHGGIGADGRRFPARPFARPAEEEAEGEISAILEAELG